MRELKTKHLFVLNTSTGNYEEIDTLTGAKGDKGDKGDVGPKPVKGTDYWTTEDKAAIVGDILEILDASAAARVIVDTDNNITLSGDLADGTYTLKYENADGSTTKICELTISGGTGEGGGTDEPDTPTYTNLVPTALTHTDLSTVFNGVGYMNGAYASSSSPYYGSDSATVCTGVIPTAGGDVFYIKGITIDASTNTHCRICLAQAHATNGGIGIIQAKEANKISDFATLETLGDQYYKLTISASYVSANTTRQPYFFLSGIGTGENLIITANEPIE